MKRAQYRIGSQAPISIRQIGALRVTHHSSHITRRVWGGEKIWYGAERCGVKKCRGCHTRNAARHVTAWTGIGEIGGSVGGGGGGGDGSEGARSSGGKEKGKREHSRQRGTPMRQREGGRTRQSGGVDTEKKAGDNEKEKRKG